MLHAGAVLLGATLLFLVQPIIGKAILPWFGGSAGVWTACMLCFQVLLLAGYAYAHALDRALTPRGQAVVHALLAVLALSRLPVAASAPPGIEATDDPTGAILALLLRAVGLPYLVLATTGPLVQAWFARSNPGRSPYPLYALSNAGSLLGLLAYPVLVEPWLTVRQQLDLFSAGFALYGVVLLACAVAQSRAVPVPPGASTAGTTATAEASAPPTRQVRGMWLALTAIASTLLMAVTNQLCQEVAVIPFLWILPLTLYLISFILCFSGRRIYARAAFHPLLVIALACMSVALHMGNQMPILGAIVLYGAGLFFGCMVCHGEWVRFRPDPQHLTSFYLHGSIGGALGGLFVALAAPRLYSGYYELPLAIIGCAMIAPIAAHLKPDDDRVPARTRQRRFLVGELATLILAAYLWHVMGQWSGGAALIRRNFYGVLKVKQVWNIECAGPVRQLVHGITKHGVQFIQPDLRRKPTSYFGVRTGIGIALLGWHPERPRRIGVIGLGVGTLAAYGKTGDTIRFYEINPLVERLARSEFTFLADCPTAIEVVLGDARRVMERESPQHYDVLVLDAFSSDAIPLHLLTREAFDLYLRHLRPDGVLAVHISNQHLDLRPVVRDQAAAQQVPARLVATWPEPFDAISGATWVLLCRDPDFFRLPNVHDAGEPLPAQPLNLRLWTDDYSNLFQILKAR